MAGLAGRQVFFNDKTLTKSDVEQKSEHHGENIIQTENDDVPL